MARLTQLRVWAFGGRAYGSFAGKPPFSPPRAPLTQLRVWGFSGQRYGAFAGKPPFNPPPGTGTPPLSGFMTNVGRMMTRRG
jgi:hypothetical protein